MLQRVLRVMRPLEGGLNWKRRRRIAKGMNGRRGRGRMEVMGRRGETFVGRRQRVVGHLRRRRRRLFVVFGDRGRGRSGYRPLHRLRVMIHEGGGTATTEIRNKTPLKIRKFTIQNREKTEFYENKMRNVIKR